MSKVLVLYYSFYGHIEAIANAVAEGARLIGRVISIYSNPRCPRSAHFHAASTPVINVN